MYLFHCRNTAIRAPGVPELTARSLGKTEIFLEWTVPASNGARHHRLRSPALGSHGPKRRMAPSWMAGATDLLDDDPLRNEDEQLTTVTLFLDTDLTAGTTYYYRIRAPRTEKLLTVATRWRRMVSRPDVDDTPVTTPSR